MAVLKVVPCLIQFFFKLIFLRQSLYILLTGSEQYKSYVLEFKEILLPWLPIAGHAQPCLI